MALFKIHKGNSANLEPNKPQRQAGFIYLTEDDMKFYIDVDSSTHDTLATLTDAEKKMRKPLNASKADMLQAWYTDPKDTPGKWTVTIPGITDENLVDGLTIRIRLSTSYYNNSQGYNTLNVNGLGPKLVYYRYNSFLTSHVPQWAEILLTYRATRSVVSAIDGSTNTIPGCRPSAYTPTAGHYNGTNLGTDGWILDAAYSDGNNYERLNNTYERRYANATYDIFPYTLCMLDKDGRLHSIVTTGTNGTTKTADPTPFRPDRIIYYSSSGKWTKNTAITSNVLYEDIPLTTAAYSINSSLSTYSDLYLVGTIDADGYFVLDNTSTTSYYKVVDTKVAAVPANTFVKDKYYLYVGASTTAANYLQLLPSHQLFFCQDTNGQKLTAVAPLATALINPKVNKYVATQTAGTEIGRITLDDIESTLYYGKPNAFVWTTNSNGQLILNLSMSDSASVAAPVMPAASTTQNGALTHTAQTIAGIKTFNDIVKLKASQYADTAGTGSLDLQNSDIYNVNSIKFADASDSAAEGLQWYRDSTHVDSLWVQGGNIKFTPNREWGTTGTTYNVLHTGNLNPTWVGWTNGTTAGPTGKATFGGATTTAVTLNIGAIPAATASVSGVVTTTTQSFAGSKTFTNADTFEVRADVIRFRNKNNNNNQAGTNPYITSLLLGDGREITFDEYNDGSLALHIKKSLFIQSNGTDIKVYNPESTYALNAIVWYNKCYYVCTTAIETPEEWNATHWRAISTSAANIIIQGNVYPLFTNTNTLGTTTYRWKALYVGTANSYGSAYVPIFWDSGVPKACSSPSMLVNLGSTTAANVFAASPSPGVTGTLAVGNGGTGLASHTEDAILTGNGSNAIQSSATYVRGSMLETGRYFHNVAEFYCTNTPKEVLIKTKIPFTNGNIMPKIFIHMYNYSGSIPAEITLGFYIYNGAFCNYGATSDSEVRPLITLSTYTENSQKYVAIGLGLIGTKEYPNSYYTRFNIDALDLWANRTAKTTYWEGWTITGNTTTTSVIPEDDRKTIDYKDQAASVTDAGNGSKITFKYSAAGMTSTSWVGSWDGYTLKAISPQKLRSTMGLGDTLGVLPVLSGGTGVSELTAGYALIGDGTNAVKFRQIRNNTSQGALGWTAAATDITLVTTNTIAYWNGAYQGTTSNLKYLGTVVGGTWQASTIGVAYGGTGLTSSPSMLVNLESETADTILKASPQPGVTGTLPVKHGGTGATSFTANCVIMSGSSTTAALTTRAVTNNTSNTAITNNTNIPTMNTIYYGLAVINNASQNRGVSIYAPTSAGSNGQFLISSGGTSAPTWKSGSDLQVGTATQANKATQFTTKRYIGIGGYANASFTFNDSNVTTNPNTEGQTIRLYDGTTSEGWKWYQIGALGGWEKEISTAKSLRLDPYFKEGTNGCNYYNNNGANGNLTLERIPAIDGTPTNSGYVLRITVTGTCNPNWGGFHQTFTSRANARFIHKFIAKIPEGYAIGMHNNPLGNNAQLRWLTNNVGTGKWETYVCEWRCGADGSFSSGGYFALNGGATPTASAPLIWYVAACWSFDLGGVQYPAYAETWTAGGSNSATPVYLDNGILKKCGFSFGASINASGNANRLAYYSAVNTISSGSKLYSDGSVLAVNKDNITSGYAFEVAGKTILGSTTAGNGTNTHIVYGHIVINPAKDTANSYSEGLRINLGSNAWSTIALGGADGTTSATGDGIWLVGVNSKNFYISHNGSSSASTRIQGQSTGFRIYPKLAVNADINSNYQAYINGKLGVNGIIYGLDTTDSSSIGTGSMILSGGLSVAKAVWINSSLNAPNTATLTTAANKSVALWDGNTLKKITLANFIDTAFTLTTITCDGGTADGHKPQIKALKEWVDTGITGSDLATGSYIVQMYFDGRDTNMGHYLTYYTGIMSWYADGTNATGTDEIWLHAAGHSSSGHNFYLRTVRRANNDSTGTTTKLQISSDVDMAAAKSFTFKFRKMI